MWHCIYNYILKKWVWLDMSQDIEEIELEEFTVKEMVQILDIEYCPFCGYKLRMLD